MKLKIIFRMKAPPLITTIDHLKHEIELLETMNEIEIAVSSLSENCIKNRKNEKKNHPLDYQYDCLKWELKLIDQQSNIYKVNNFF